MKMILCILLLALQALPVLGANSERNFGGVGIDGVPLPDGRIRVGQIVSGGPAHQAGVRVGDVITHIDGKATQGSDFRVMVQKRLRGVAGSPVVIRVRRSGEDKPLSFRLVRRQIVVNPVKEAR